MLPGITGQHACASLVLHSTADSRLRQMACTHCEHIIQIDVGYSRPDYVKYIAADLGGAVSQLEAQTRSARKHQSLLC